MAFEFIGGAAGGAAEGLEQVLRRVFLEAQQRQQAELAREQMEVQRRGQGVQMRGQDLAAGQARDRLTFDRDKETEDTRRYNLDQPGIAKFRAAQTENLDREPIEAADRRAHEGMMEEKRNTNELGQIEARGGQDRQTARFRASIDTQQGGRRQLQQIIGADGTPQIVSVDVTTGQSLPVQLPEGATPNRPAKPVTGSERQTLAYFNRAKEAADLAAQFEEGVAGAGLLSQVQQQFAPNILQTSDQQRYRQAQRAFTEARLRKESGAAIPQGEYDNDSRTYFAQPGDSPQVRAQKKQARETVLEGLKFSSGRAYQEFYGHEGTAKGESDAAKKAADLIKKYGGG